MAPPAPRALVGQLLILLRKIWFFAGLALVVFLGIQQPAVGAALKPYINAGIFVSLLLVGLRLDLTELLSSLRNFRAIAVCLFCGFIFMPLVSFALAKGLFSSDQAIFVGVVLAGAMPTTQVSSVIWTDMSRGNSALAVVLMSASNVLGVVLSPLILFLLLGASMQFPVVDMMRTLFEFVLLPVAIGQIIRALAGQMPARLQFLSKFVNILVIWASVLTAMALGNVRSLPLAAVAVSVTVQYLATSLFSYFTSRLLGLRREEALAVMFCASQVTLTAAVVIGFSYFPAGSIIYVVIYHLFQQIMGQLTAQYMERAKRREGAAVS